MSEENKITETKTIRKMEDKWDACLDLGVRRLFYSSLAGSFGALLLFRSPVTRWATVALGAGVGLGSAYTECSYKFSENFGKPTIPRTVEVPSPEPPQDVHE